MIEATPNNGINTYSAPNTTHHPFKTQELPQPPCITSCPVNTDVQAFISLTRQGRLKEALDVIRERCTLPASLGRICHHPCESECRRKKVDEAVSIRSIKKFVTDVCRNVPYPSPVPKTKNKKIAIIGGGPSGLTAAYDLAREGFNITIIEKNDSLGGTLYTGVPRYRLPKDALDWDVKSITSLGIDVKTNTEIGKDIQFDAIKKDFDAVLLAVGLPISKKIPIPGIDAEGVFFALPFLRKINLQEEVKIKGKVIVIGGGNVALDVARTALRLGAEKVTIAYRRTEADMPARTDEIEDAKKEGVKISTLLAPERIVEEGGKVTGIVLKRCLSVLDENGAFNLKYDDTDLTAYEADIIIISIGQEADLSAFKGTGLLFDDNDRLYFNQSTMQTNLPKVFACGEVVTGPGSCVEAIKSGHKAASAIKAYLEDKEFIEKTNEYISVIDDIPASTLDKITKLARFSEPLLDITERTRTFKEISTGFELKAAMIESQRCMACGGATINQEKCAVCLNCVRICPFSAPNIKDGKEVCISIESCQGCGICASECPRLAISIKYNNYALLDRELKNIAKIKSKEVNSSYLIVAFVCQVAFPKINNPKYVQLDYLSEYLKDIHIISIYNNNLLRVIHILKAFEESADGVIIADCSDSSCLCCKNIDWLKQKVAVARKILDDIALGSERLYEVSVGTSPKIELKEAATALKKKLNEIGHNPLNKVYALSS